MSVKTPIAILFKHWVRLKEIPPVGEYDPKLGPLLIRYRILSTHWCRVFIHNLRRSDTVRHAHDHPWNYLTIILRGAYIEHTPSGSRKYKLGSILFRRATSIHQLEVEEPTWTLFIAGRSRREWGFHTDEGWRLWSEYDQARGNQKL